MERLGFVCGVERQVFCHLLLAFPSTLSMIPGQENFPQPQVPHGTSGYHGITQRALHWQPKSFGGRRQALPSTTGTKVLLLTMGLKGPNRTRPPKHIDAWQPWEMAVWTEGVGGKQVLECPALWLLLFLLRELTSVLPLGRSMGGRRP